MTTKQQPQTYPTGFEAVLLVKKPELTPEVLAAALRAFRAAKTQFMISEEEASRMIAQAVIEALPQ